jgi:O-methyltransferase
MSRTPSALYLDLLKRCLTNVIYEDPSVPMPWNDSDGGPFDLQRRALGEDWPAQAHTMIGLRRLDQIEALLTDVLRRGVPGDVIEAGVGRGGATIFMRALLAVHGDRTRRVIVADSFRGLPRTSAPFLSERSYRSSQFATARRPENRERARSSIEQLARGASLDEVSRNFERYGLLDEQVVFLPGWFHETLGAVGTLAFVRIDADLYDSTIQALDSLYPRLSAGGYVVIDDYHIFDECRAAVHDYLRSIGEEPAIDRQEGMAACWLKPSAVLEAAPK